MNWWQALILGVVEGVTEYLPVSSTGHLILVAWLLGLDQTSELKQATDTFTIVIQFGAILAVFLLYRRRIWQVAKGVIGRDEQGAKLAVNLFAAFLPAAVFGLLLVDVIERFLFKPWPVVGALFVGAWLMVAVGKGRRFGRGVNGLGLEQITLPVAVMIGTGQCLAMWPGTSRSMITIVAALLLGLRAKAAAEFSFLLGLITLSAATGYKIVVDGQQMLQHVDVAHLSLGVVAATISAAIAVRWFVATLTRRGLAPFGWYRMVLAVVWAVSVGAGWLTVQAEP